MELHQFLRSRRSVRRFRADPVPPSAIERILGTATFAPSAHNRQPWRFAVLTDSAVKSRLGDAMAEAFRGDLEGSTAAAGEISERVEKSRQRISSAPVIIVLCINMSDMDVYPDDRRHAAERTMATQSTANAGLQILLAASAEGLGAYWNCGPLFAPQAVQRALGLPEQWEPQGMVLLGFAAEQPEPRQRKSYQEVTIFQ